MQEALNTQVFLPDWQYYRGPYNISSSPIYIGINIDDSVYVIGGSFGDVPQKVGTYEEFRVMIQSTVNNGTSGGVKKFDLTEYLFPDETDRVGGSISYLVKSYKKYDGQAAMASIQRLGRASEDTIAIDDGSGGFQRTVVIGKNNIEETIHSDNVKRNIRRFVSVGDTTMDSTWDSSDGKENTKFVIIDHFDNFNLATSTGSFNLASGIHKDVLYIRCQTGLIIDGQLKQISDLHYYYAKGKGSIFLHGLFFEFGELYFIPEKF